MFNSGYTAESTIRPEKENTSGFDAQLCAKSNSSRLNLNIHFSPNQFF